MTRKFALTPLERDIIVQLDEAGAEELSVLLNSLSDEDSHYPPRQHVLQQFEQGLQNLIRLGKVELLLWTGPAYKKLEEEQAAALFPLRSWLIWDAEKHRWMGSPKGLIHPVLLGRIL